ncbi:metal ABC transporter substrate-binding protein [Paralimibaculum aggregatum]|uniref:Metal ABC transporter substrate-binding protein n=1 Tax=Paralimibaculum aggregatum TaxID=3036245 RepID=A0ABQ6LTQ8_9RHOB|nr:metal ABC transporter substrate-binding protein [Limibaculum sp. NKW23]GMG85488.1 metal ABC transporter substrate-binding protein [Limibaculum sp. NKW23]
MQTRRTLLKSGVAALGVTLAMPASARANDPIPVVATFSILGDMVARIGGEHVALTTLVGPNGDTHVFQPTPADAQAVADAKILFVNGLEFEGWLDRLVDASGFQGTRVVATDGIEPIPFDAGGHDEHEHDERGENDVHAESEHGHGDDRGEDHGEERAEADGRDHHDHGVFDPHAWQSLRNAAIYAANIAKALAEADPQNAAAYEQNRAAYVAEIEALDAEIRTTLAALPADRRTIVTSHDAFQYFGHDYGLTFLAPQGLSTESEASAKDVARLIERIRKEKISAVFVENITDRRLLEQIARETGASIGGTLYPGALSGPDGPSPTYLDMMRHNAATLAQALSS